MLFNKKAKEDPLLEKQAQQMLIEWENNNKEIRELWKKMNKWVLDGFEVTYNIFDNSSLPKNMQLL